MITGHCSSGRHGAACPAQRACACACHVSAGNPDELELAGYQPIRGAQLHPAPAAPPDRIPPPSPELVDGLDAGAVFSAGLTDLSAHQHPQEPPMPRKPSLTCTVCGKAAKSVQGLGVHQTRAHGRPTNPPIAAAPIAAPELVVADTEIAADGVTHHAEIIPLVDSTGQQIGTVSITISASLFDLTPDDRAALFAAVDGLRELLGA